MNVVFLFLIPTMIIFAGLFIIIRRDRRIHVELLNNIDVINANLPIQIFLKQDSDCFVMYNSKRTTGRMSASETKRLLTLMGEDANLILDVFDENSNLIRTKVDFMKPKEK